MREECRYLENVSFLLIDPSIFMRSVVRNVLNTFGAKKIIEASNGEEALEELKAFMPDIILTEWVMSPINGIELAKHLRRDDDSPNVFIPIIMITAHTELIKIATARDAGINEFVAKPMSAKGLLDHINEVIEHPRNYVKEDEYFGPDRRRRRVKSFRGKERRHHVEKLEDASKLDQDQIDAVVAGDSITPHEEEPFEEDDSPEEEEKKEED